MPSPADAGRPGGGASQRPRTVYVLLRIAAPHPSTSTGAGSFSWIPAAVVPHPSGINPWWNDEQNRSHARGFFSQLLARVDGKEW